MRVKLRSDVFFEVDVKFDCEECIEMCWSVRLFVRECIFECCF